MDVPSYGAGAPQHTQHIAPDVMNDPEYATNGAHADDEAGDQDTCRICRGEATEQEPLFYPCRCSGSIKFVHQDCLMEWLGHSQKKHCELCKTPFRFTKLYASNMPPKLPVHIFLRHLVVHLFKNIATWLRMCLVAVVWLGALPWMMRHIWGLLFWFADGGWSLRTTPTPSFNVEEGSGPWNKTLALAAWEKAAGLAAVGTSPASPLLAQPTTSPAIRDFLKNIASVILSHDSTFDHVEPSLRDIVVSLSRRMSLWEYDMLDRKPYDVGSSNQTFAFNPIVPNHSSLLSNVQFLNNLTRSRRLNTLIITCLEGQIITVVVVVCFILIFLIREWVVQQQPGINIGAGFNAEFANADRAVREDEHDDPAEHGDPVDRVDRLFREFEELEGVIGRMQDNPRPRPLARLPRRRVVRFEENPANNVGMAAHEAPVEDGSAADTAMPATRDAENGQTVPEQMNATEFYNLFQRAHSNADNAFRIAEEEGLTERLGHWARFLTELQASEAEAARSVGNLAADPELQPDDATNFDGSRGTVNQGLHDQGSSRQDKDEVTSTQEPHSDAVTPTKTTSEDHDSPIAELSSHFDMENDDGSQEDEPQTNVSDFAVSGSPEPVERANSALSLNSESVSDEQTRVEDSPTGTPRQDETAPVDTPVNADTPAPVAPRIPPEGILEHVADWLWGDMAAAPAGEGLDDEHIVENIDEEEPFVPVGDHHDHRDLFGDAPLNDHVAAAFGDADLGDPNDPDAIDDAEDFDGIMELIGMRGPVAGLLQNALFGAVLISLTVALGVWVPYSVGKLTLLLVANPISTIKLPLRLVFKAAAVLQDITLVVLGFVSYAVMRSLSLLMLLSRSLGTPIVSTEGGVPAFANVKFAYSAGERITNGLITVMTGIPDSEIPAFSAASHEALLQIKSILSRVLSLADLRSLFTVTPSGTVVPSFNYLQLQTVVATFGRTLLSWLSTLPATLAKSETWVITLSGSSRTEPIELALSYWDGTDRIWAIVTGYMTFVVLGAAYVRKGSPFSTTQNGKDWEALIIDVLNQAGGVMKVILIISIEMLVFPLYCGLLLDLATLPLFDGATLMSRFVFAMRSPFTSMFVHWFTGTCYMFHFALFVSMCRKILRPGVLYFIRDPDDPTFHPVRDVLERNVATQLRKITFSAMVYGALVLVCLGGVVWSLAFALPGVLPIRWSSNEPVLEFPIDLLFYNFLMPVAVQYLKPADGLQAMYAWWFDKCARLLRLSWFLLDKRRIDEEIWPIQWGLSEIPSQTEYREIAENGPIRHLPFDVRGRYVRAPASDMVRIPKDGKVFLEVNAKNERTDGKPDHDEGLHGKKSKLFQMVYAPPSFRFRIFLFIFLLWLFTAITGCSITIIPLVFGRWVFGALLPGEVKKNDIYAFSMGINTLGMVLYCLLHLRSGMVRARNALVMNVDTPLRILRRAGSVLVHGLRLLYIYSAFVFVLPSLFALVVEFYVIIPLHTYFYPTESHTIEFVQTWTLGLLFFNLARRCLLWYADTRPAEALRAIVRNGLGNPDVRLATRSFIFPILVLSLLLIDVPFMCAWAANGLHLFGNDVRTQILVYRYAFPAVTALGAGILGVAGLSRVVRGWRMKIRDEVYLIGERLHNFGEASRRKPAPELGIRGMARIET